MVPIGSQQFINRMSMHLSFMVYSFETDSIIHSGKLHFT